MAAMKNLKLKEGEIEGRFHITAFDTRIFKANRKNAIFGGPINNYGRNFSESQRRKRSIRNFGFHFTLPY